MKIQLLILLLVSLCFAGADWDTLAVGKVKSVDVNCVTMKDGTIVSFADAYKILIPPVIEPDTIYHVVRTRLPLKVHYLYMVAHFIETVKDST
jgi:hypothetical protein